MLVPVFLMGVVNFALHGAVLASRHPLFERIGWLAPRRAHKVSLGLEFLVLTLALGFAYRDAREVLWFYGSYTAINAVSTWLLVSRRL